MPMPRFTYIPSSSSCAARAAIWLRSQAMISALPNGALFDAFLVIALNEAVHVDAGQVDGIGIERALGHNLFDLKHAGLAAHGRRRIEVAGGLAEDGIPGLVGLPRLDDRKIGKDAPFENICLAVEILVLLALGHLGSDTCLGVEAGNAGATGAHPLGQGALGVEFDLKLARKILTHEFGVFAHIGAEHLF